MLNNIVDLYHNDAVAGEDFAAVKAGGTEWLIHKASQSLSYVDPAYALRRVRATRAGINWGAYHFADGSDGVRQADHFLQSAQPEPSTMMALDLERNPNGPMVTIVQARAFVQRILQVTGRRPWIYGSDIVANFAGAHGDSVLCQCPLWIARYGHPPVVPPGWAKWTLWQYAAGEMGGDKLPGLGHVDRSQFNGDSEALKKVWAA